jgi:alpha-L-fucosidase
MGSAFSFRYEDHYKSVRELIHLFIEIVTKGGNLALNVGPQPDGRISRTAISRIQGMGDWLKVYGEAIYGTRICEPYSIGNLQFTQKADKVYAFHLYKDEEARVPQEIILPLHREVSRIDLIGSYDKLEFRQTEQGVSIRLPDAETGGKAPIAHVFRIQ